MAISSLRSNMGVNKRQPLNQTTQQQQVKKKVENLARTGTEYPIAKMQHTFIPDHPAQEPFSKQ